MAKKKRESDDNSLCMTLKSAEEEGRENNEIVSSPLIPSSHLSLCGMTGTWKAE